MKPIKSRIVIQTELEGFGANPFPSFADQEAPEDGVYQERMALLTARACYRKHRTYHILKLCRAEWHQQHFRLASSTLQASDILCRAEWHQHRRCTSQKEKLSA
jgi:hypothetical protein